MKHKIIFFDIGGVLLTNGWGHESRHKAAKHFNINYAEMDKLHDFIFNIFETGKITLDEYLHTTVFNQKRDFSLETFKEFMFSQSKELPYMLQWLIKWKNANEYIRIIALNNEGKELNEFRINKFNLHCCFDAFITSCEVGMRKPDPGIYKLALGIAQANANECYYFDDRPMLIEAGKKAGLNVFLHKDFETTKTILEKLTTS